MLEQLKSHEVNLLKESMHSSLHGYTSDHSAFILLRRNHELEYCIMMERITTPGGGI